MLLKMDYNDFTHDSIVKRMSRGEINYLLTNIVHIIESIVFPLGKVHSEQN